MARNWQYWVFSLWVATLFWGRFESLAQGVGGFGMQTGTNAFFRTESDIGQITQGETFTAELWVKPTGPGVILNEVDAYLIPEWDYTLLELSSNGELRMSLPGVPGVLSLGLLPFNEWSHLAIRYHSNTLSYSGFINGVNKGTISGARITPGEAGRSAYWAFGRHAGNNLAGGGYLDGVFDEIRIWGRARSDEEISSNWNKSLSGAELGLRSNWNVDVGSGSLIHDDTGNNLHGLVVGAIWVPSDLALVGGPPIISNFYSANTEDPKSISLVAILNPNGSQTEVVFEYGLSEAYGSESPKATLAGVYSDLEVSVTLSNLPTGTYNYRVRAENAAGTNLSENATFYVSGLAGSALALDGVDDYFRTEAPTRPFFQDKSFTIELWFLARGPGVIVNEVDAITVSEWDYSLLELLSNGRLVAGLPGLQSVDLGTVELDRWHHAAIRYEDSTDLFDVFIDGIKAGSTSGERMVPWDSGRSVYFSFGRGGATNLGGGGFFRGLIDEVRIWRDPRTQSEIQQSMSLLLQGGGLFALWHLDTISGDYSPNSSDYPNPARIVGGLKLEASTIDLKEDHRPLVVTEPAEDLNLGGATLKGLVDPNLGDTTVFFLWGEGLLTNQTPEITIPGNAGTTEVEAVLTGLRGGTTYYYALVGGNSSGTNRGSTRTFIVPGSAGYAVRVSSFSYFRNVNDQQAFFTDESITIELWVKPANAGVIVGESDRQGPQLLDMSVLEVLGSGNVIAAFPGLPLITLGKVIFNEWNHVVLRYDRLTQRMDGIINGVVSAESSTGDRVAPWEIGRAGIFTFGKATREKIGTGRSLTAEIDEIRLWNGVRSDASILGSRNFKLEGSEPLLIAYYTFDERTSSVFDASRHNNVGQIQGISGAFAISSAPVVINFQPIILIAPGEVSVEFRSTSGNEIVIESSDNLKDWVPVSTNLVNSLGIGRATINNITGQSHRFFRSKDL